MVATQEAVDLAVLPEPPMNPLSYREKTRALREYHSGIERLRDAGGPVTRMVMGPRWLIPDRFPERKPWHGSGRTRTILRTRSSAGT